PPATIQTKMAPSTVAARLPFRPMLISVPGARTTPDGIWRIEVSEASLAISHSNESSDGKALKRSGWITVSPDRWKAQPGWFVFIENESRVWSYDGDRRLMLQTETSSGNNSQGATYSSRFPCPVPPEVYARIPEPAKTTIKRHE